MQRATEMQRSTRALLHGPQNDTTRRRPHTLGTGGREVYSKASDVHVRVRVQCDSAWLYPLVGE